MGDSLGLRLLRFLPRNLLSRGMGWVARRRRPRFIVRPGMRWFARRYRLDLDEAEKTFDEYESLVDLFTRRLKPGAREIATGNGILVSPVDAGIGAFGAVENGRLIQAKGLDYALSALLGSEKEAAPFRDGWFVTLYLSPRDYHRIHVPVDGTLERTIYEPGTLWPVNEEAVRRIPQLFAVNERITSRIATAHGPVAAVMVGATNVGTIRLAHHDDLVSNRGGKACVIDSAIAVARGDDLGTFELGSTVILVVADPDFEPVDLETGAWVPLGSKLGTFSRTPTPSS